MLPKTPEERWREEEDSNKRHKWRNDKHSEEERGAVKGNREKKERRGTVSEKQVGAEDVSIAEEIGTCCDPRSSSSSSSSRGLKKEGIRQK